MKKTFIILTALTLCACSHLSKEAKKIAGTYYNTEVSQTEPVMQLRRDASCTITAIKPGVLTYSVDGKWNVVSDSLVIELEPSSVKFEGDSTLIGQIPARVAQKVVSYTDFSLQLENQGVSYLYQRRSN